MQKIKKCLAVLLALCMCMSMLSLNAFATEVGEECPYCHTGHVTINKTTGNLTCDSCDGFEKHASGETQKPEETQPEEKPHEHSYGSNGRCECGAIDPNHAHSYDESGKCACGDQHTHSWTYTPDYYNAFQHVAYCSGCGAKHTEECTTKTVNEYGVMVVKCTLCNYWWMPVEDVHNWAENWESDGNGYHTRTCNDKGCTEIQREECKLEAFDGGVRCSVCGWVKYDDGVGGGNDSKECPDGHTYGNIGTSNGDYSHTLVCVDCGHTITEKCELSTLKENGQPVAYYCTVCGYTVPIKEPEKPYCSDGAHSWEPKKEVLSEDGKSVLTTLVCEKCGYTQITDICNSPSQVVVHYVYENGQTAAFDKTQSVIKGSSYLITSPVISGYTPDQAVVSGTCDDGKGAEYTVTYKAAPKTYTLTIDYILNGETKPFATYTKDLEDGTNYEVPSPDKTSEGYELAAGQQDAVVKGKIDGENVYVHVDYKPLTYTWTINYVDENGKQVATSVTEYFTVQSIKNLSAKQSPEVDGWIADQTSVSAPTELANKEDKVVYTPKDPDKYLLTINYVLQGADEPFHTVTEQHAAGDTYSVDSEKAPEGYELAAPQDVTVAGVMPGYDYTLEVEYKPLTYTWIINYVDENGEKLALPVTQTFTVETIGNLSDRLSPAVEGYTAGTASVAAPTGLADKTDYVIYTRDGISTPVYVLTINTYVNGVLSETASSSLSAGDPISNPGTVRDGYSVRVEGYQAVMPDGNLTINVYYTSTTPERPPVQIPDPVDPDPVDPDPVDPDPVTPDPVDPEGPEIEIPDEDTPLVDLPEDLFDIEDEDVPLAELPEELFDIEDDEVPLANVPKTGDNSLLWMILTAISSTGLAWLSLGKKREETAE